MKSFASSVAVAGVLLASPILNAQTPASPTPRSDPETLKALRQTLAEQARHPDKIIPTSNAVSSHARAEAWAKEPAPAETPVFKPEPPKSQPVSTKAAAAAALERQFLERRLSERQYRKALADLERANTAPLPVNAREKAAPETNSPKVTSSPKTSTRGILPPSEPAAPATPPKPTVKQQKVSEVETKLDEMIRQKQAREQGAQTNSVPAPGAKATKRERLDFLLKQRIDGKITNEEYKKQWEKILTEPE